MSIQVSRESDFGFDEIFYSRTDPKGKILSGNSVFQRVSGYAWQELEGKPHSVVRHPEMPRAVFWLLWKFIQAGKPIGAYVKNLSKDGTYYWVFALAMPVEGGYLSTRIKPGSELFAAVRKEYEDLLAREEAGNLQPEKSAELLIERLRALGFSSYESFMTNAICKEVSHRSAAMGVAVSPGIRAMESLTSSVASSIQESGSILASYEECLLVPLNLEVRAERLGKRAAQISVVAETYQKLMGEIREVIGTFSGMATELSRTSENASFLFAASTVISDLVTFLDRTKEVPFGGGAAREGAQLRGLAAEYRGLALEGLMKAEQAVERFRNVSLRLRRLGGNLQVVRVSGLISATEFPLQRAELEGEFEKLRQFQDSLKKGLKAIVFAAERMLLDCGVSMAEARHTG